MFLNHLLRAEYFIHHIHYKDITGGYYLLAVKLQNVYVITILIGSVSSPATDRNAKGGI